MKIPGFAAEASLTGQGSITRQMEAAGHLVPKASSWH